VQTPQCFFNANIQKAYKQKYSDKFTDDASVFESDGGEIKTIIGDIKNMKITTSEDLKIAGVLM
jgi:2-C-methyl-D-erythritol 4-phosphate cytidylyltransferase